MAPKTSKAPKQQAKYTESPKEYPTIAAKLEAEYLASRPYQVLKETKGFSKLISSEKIAYAHSILLETGAWRTWAAPQQKEFWKLVEQQKIPIPLPKPPSLGKDQRGIDLGSYTPAEYKLYERRERDLRALREKSNRFRIKRAQGWTEEEVEEERNRRKLLGHLQVRKMGIYERDPEWDDVIPLEQDDGDGALAAIAYSDEYAEAMGYLRAIMAAKEYSPRVLGLTEHIISLNASHYTVWLYRARTLFALESSIEAELEWMNKVALDNQKNYQIWHHRQILIDNLYVKISSDHTAIENLADTETAFMARMFDEDSKNYHVWSYRQYLVRKLDLFNQKEIESIETLLRSDIKNNSAWSHRFFVVFSDPKISTPGSLATERDFNIPSEIIDREIEFAKSATFDAPQNQSPWNYLRGVLTKGSRKLATQECFAGEFAKIPKEGEEDVKSSHALDFLADVWAEKKEFEKAERALDLLADKYDRIRKNYWMFKRSGLRGSELNLSI
ncbi:related to geranylgeranyltransferase type I alpha subunit (RAM2) [Rhynchosporium secalis]|uniref:Protein farnesyltransferase/geranylgeranyltransferase type-1 subunit alpha n=1 Tax=Rhynchosporium secalis TaxID=38038 RepID=A0A1E1MEI5_RHYSE|nr:related to geranylgeranyltransferase type I alpha subunit (RAM2) [Rhynchosporium secalis]